MATRGSGEDRGRGGGGGSGGAGMGYDGMAGHNPSDAGSSSSFNRNSHPFTEREVEQGFRQMEGMCKMSWRVGQGGGQEVV